MTRDYDDLLALKRQIFLGGKVSKKIPFFEEISPLGYDYAEQLAALRFWQWIKQNRKDGKKVSVEEKLEKAIKLLGKADFLRNTKELTRLSMILSDTTKREEFEE